MRCMRHILTKHITKSGMNRLVYSGLASLMLAGGLALQRDRSWPNRHQPRSPSSGRGDGPPCAGSELGVGPGALSLERRTLCVGTWSIH